MFTKFKVVKIFEIIKMIKIFKMFKIIKLFEIIKILTNEMAVFKRTMQCEL